MKIVLLCGKNENQKALANKLAKQFNLVGLVIEEPKNNKKSSIFFLLNKVIDKLFFHKINSAWHSLMKMYAVKYPIWPKIKTLKISNINDKKVIEFITNLKPELIMVSGTRLLKGDFIEQLNPTKGIINLHTGVSPYVKGGPNCTNWCIAEGNFHLIGNTIMWLDKGIDSGNIITTEPTTFNKNENLISIHEKVMEHAHELYLKVVKLISLDNPIPNNAQCDIAHGKLYLTKNWNLSKKRSLLKNLKQFNTTYGSKSFMKKQKETKFISLN